MERVQEIKLLGSSTECASSGGSTRGSMSGYEASRSSNGSIPRQRNQTNQSVPLEVIYKTKDGKVIKRSFFSGESEKVVEFAREMSAVLLTNVTHISLGSFDIEKTTSSTPLPPDRPEASDSDSLFSSMNSGDCVRGAEVAGDEMDTLPPAPIDSQATLPPDDAPSARLFMDPEGLKKLELVEVSEESDDSEPDTFSPVPSLPFSLPAGRGHIDDQNVAVQCSPDFECSPSPDMFKDIKFVLSCEAQEESQIHVASLRKDSYAKFITRGGGIVYDTIPSDTRNTVLISGQPSHSETYLRALLLGIPCVKSKWIDHVIGYRYTFEQCRIPEIEHSMFLPRGLDLVKRQYIPQSKKHIGNPPKPLAGEIVYLQGSNLFKDTWCQIIENGGGNGLKRWFRSATSPSTSPTIVLSEGTRKPSVTTINFGVEIVTVEWVIQSIILGVKADSATFRLKG